MTTADPLPSEDLPVAKPSMKSLEIRVSDLTELVKELFSDLGTRIMALEAHQAIGPDDPNPVEMPLDLIIGVTEALRCAGINTAARMAEELESKYYPPAEGLTGLGSNADKVVLSRFPWMSDYR